MSDENKKYSELAKKSLEREIEDIEKISNIPPDLMTYGWKDYKFEDNEQTDEKGNKIKLDKIVIESRRQAWISCASYAKNLPLMYQGLIPFASLLITGTKGSGKSVLGSLILRESINKLREKVLYVQFTKLLSELHIATCKSSFEYNDQVSHIMEKYYGDPKILMIDEIDSGHYVSKPVQEHINTILTMRADWHKPTIITSRLPYESLSSVIGLPAYRIVGKQEYYVHINIMNNGFKTPNELLSSETEYPIDKCSTLIKWLEEIVKINKENKMKTGIYGHQIRSCLESGLRFGKQDNITKNKIMNNARSMISEEYGPTEKTIEEAEKSQEVVKTNNLKQMSKETTKDLKNNV
jgi:DNA replication protein DnaC